MSRAITRLPAALGAPTEVYELPAAKRLRGNPQQMLWITHTGAGGAFLAGSWRSEPGAWRVAYTEEEYCRILEGYSVLTSDGGEVFTLVAGDEFVVPAGFCGTWEVVQTTTKRFVIYEPPVAVEPAPGA